MSELRVDKLSSNYLSKIQITGGSVLDVSGSQTAIKIPSGTQAQRPTDLSNAYGSVSKSGIRCDVDDGELEGYVGSGGQHEWTRFGTTEPTKIVESGLIWHIDASNPKSYNVGAFTNASSLRQVFDLSGRNTRYPARLVGNTFVDGDGFIDLTVARRTDDYFYVQSQVLTGMSRWTLDWWLYMHRNNSGINTIFTCGAANNMLFHFQTNLALEFQNPSVYTSPDPIGEEGSLFNLTAVGDSGTIYIYKNGTLVWTFSATTSISVPGFAGSVFGQEYDADTSPGTFDGTQKFCGKYGPVKFYNRPLSSEEVEQNYNAVADKYKLNGYDLP